MRKRSLTIKGHRTSVTLEDIFWSGLKEAAREDNLSIAALVSTIDSDRDGGLASALRIWLYRRALQRQKDTQHLST